MKRNRVLCLLAITLFSLCSCQNEGSKKNSLKFDVSDLKEILLREDGTYGYNSRHVDLKINIYYFDFLEENQNNNASQSDEVTLIKFGDFRWVNDGEEILGDIFATNFSTPRKVHELLINLIITAENPPYGLRDLEHQFKIGSNWDLTQTRANCISLDGYNNNYGYLFLQNYLFKSNVSNIGGEYLFANFATIAANENSRIDYLSFTIDKNNEFIPLVGYLPTEVVTRKDNKIYIEGNSMNESIECNQFSLSYKALIDSPSIKTKLNPNFCPSFKFDYFRSNDESGIYADYASGMSFQASFSRFGYLLGEEIPTIFKCETTLSINKFEHDLPKLNYEKFNFSSFVSNF